MGHTIYTDKHHKHLEVALKSALMLILTAMKTTPTEALESELNIVPIDLRLKEQQLMEAIKLLQKNDQFITNNIGEKVNCKKSTPLKVRSTTFLLVYFVSVKESTCVTRKNYFTSEALFVLEIIKF